MYRLSSNEVILWSVSAEQFIAEAALVLLGGCLGAIVKTIHAIVGQFLSNFSSPDFFRWAIQLFCSYVIGVHV
jgi:hypothetical protein